MHDVHPGVRPRDQVSVGEFNVECWWWLCIDLRDCAVRCRTAAFHFGTIYSTFADMCSVLVGVGVLLTSLRMREKPEEGVV